MSLFIHQSNMLERLADILARNIAAEPPGPFEKETFLVLSKGMERWLSLELAGRLGVWAGGEFLFPNRLVHRLLEALVPEEERPDTSLFEKEFLTWRIMRLLPDLMGGDIFSPVAAYLRSGKDAGKTTSTGKESPPGGNPDGTGGKEDQWDGAVDPPESPGGQDRWNITVDPFESQAGKGRPGTAADHAESGGKKNRRHGRAGQAESPGGKKQGNAASDPPEETELNGGRDAAGVRLYQLACRLADAFDQYAVYRPDLLENWWKGAERDDWQARLWRSLVDDADGGCGRAELHGELLSRLADPAVESVAPLPRRLSVFGISTLPPGYITLLSELASHLPVHIYFLNPSSVFWVDSLSRKEVSRLVVKEGGAGARHNSPYGVRPDDAAEGDAAAREPIETEEANQSTSDYPGITAFGVAGEKSPTAEPDLHFDQGNPLLGSFGREGRDFLSLLVGLDSGAGEELFEDPGEEDMLHAVRKDILESVERGSRAGTRAEKPDPSRETGPPAGSGELPDRPEASSAAGGAAGTPDSQGGASPAAGGSDEAPHRLVVSDDDRSIRIHVCHGPAREIEVLHDRLLDMFDADASLTPRDIVVMAPDIEEYAPHVEAVFSAGRAEGVNIPFSIADRGESAGDRVFDGFFALLDLAGGRFGAAGVLGALEIGPVREKAGFNDMEMELVRHWIVSLRIRWGVDARHRESLGLPGYAENTWRAGLDRLLLGYVFPAGGDKPELFRGILPFGDVEGDSAVTAGKLAAFIGKLSGRAGKLAAPSDAAAWRDLLTGIVDDFIAENDETTSSMQALRRVVSGIASRASKAGFDALLDKNMVRAFLDDELGARYSSSGFLSGRVTFCSMLPMRSIPFDVVCLLGMSDTVFPRTDRRPGFNRLAEKPRPGDRSRRDDDRYQFLEAILSARKRLYISYTGRSIRDNSEFPPSPVVDELKDYIARGFTCASGDILSHIETVHPLQPFDASYFDRSDPALFSYSKSHCLPAAAATDESAARFLQAPLPAPAAGTGEPAEVDAARFIRFFENPAAAFLRDRLGVFFPRKEPEIRESEPFAVEGLDQYLLDDELLDARLEGIDPFGMFDQVRAGGGLPHGFQGETAFRKHAALCIRIADSISLYDRSERLGKVSVASRAGGILFTGEVNDLRRLSGAGELLRIGIRPALLKGKDWLRAWIIHLLLNDPVVLSTIEGGANGVTSYLAGWKNSSASLDLRRFPPVGDPEPILDVLVKYFQEGKLRPLPFFPKASFEFAAGVGEDPSLAGESKLRSGRKRAWTAWEDSFGSAPSESEDRSFAACFRGCEPLDAEFESIAWAVFGPILDCAVAVKDM